MSVFTIIFAVIIAGLAYTIFKDIIAGVNKEDNGAPFLRYFKKKD